MKRFTVATALAAALMTSTSCNMNNPLLVQSEAPYGAPAFDKIKIEHYKPAFNAAVAEGKAEIKAIVANAAEPTFENTIEALERSGGKLDMVSNIFFNLNECCTNPEMQQIAEDVSPMLTEYGVSILLNPDLFKRVKAVYDHRDALQLTPEQRKLLEDTYRSFARNGANLPDDKKAEYSKVQEELSLATLKFGRNVLAASNVFTMNLTDEADLEGLPAYVREMAASEASNRGGQGWTFTLDQPSYSPFMKFSARRDLREKMWRAYNTKSVGGEFDNIQTIKDIISLRLKEANLLGYETYADYSLEETMAKDRATVDSFLDNLREKSYPFALRDVAEIQQYAASKGFEGQLMPWDFAYWSEKFRDEKYALNEELLKPYFQLDSVQAAVFGLANTLYGLNFNERTDIPVYHPDVRVFEVTDGSGRFMALLYMDYFPRESKRGGAWMTEFRGMATVDGVEERPFVSVVTNFTKPTATEPSLLTFDEVTTLLHEFGHALHGMMAEGTYRSLTGTNVDRDFVELPSQIMENWAYEPEYLKTFAKHYKTGEVIPQEYLDRIVAAKNFLAGYACIRQLNYGTVDMEWHSLKSIPEDLDVVAFEQEIVNRAPIMPSVEGVVFSPSFSHIFAGGYSAGYYSYKWAEVLEADAFSLFKERGIFDRGVAGEFRSKLLSKGGTVDAAELFRDFRGRDPQPDALLEKMGMK
ncbi:MAG: M3 family metallopeptidase [Bacteroidales bacterium]|nr:M3 family metallopeptidase [Bacteroidales bacterium]